jgi:hypothetical protein
MKRSVDAVVKASEAHGPFDGVLSFSQGAAFFRALYFYTQVLYPEQYKAF